MARTFQARGALIKTDGGSLNPDAVARFYQNTRNCGGFADGSCGLSPAARLRRFADLASAHVRYEERVLFPELQSHPYIAFAHEQDHT